MTKMGSFADDVVVDYLFMARHVDQSGSCGLNFHKVNLHNCRGVVELLRGLCD